MTLGEALRNHRQQHPGCQGCDTYLDIARRYTSWRERPQGPVMGHPRLSVIEPRFAP